MKRKKFLALALAGVMTAATLTACAPLEDLYDWFFGSGSGSASHGSEKGRVTESEALDNKLEPLKDVFASFLKPQQATGPRRRLRQWQKNLTRTWLTPDSELNDQYGYRLHLDPYHAGQSAGLNQAVMRGRDGAGLPPSGTADIDSG